MGRGNDLGNYPSEINGLAEELSNLVDQSGLRSAATALYKAIGDKLFAMTPDETAKALKFLSQTPSQRSKVLAKLDPSAAATLILRARYLCMMSYNAMNFAENFFYVPGKGYREAAEYGARMALGASFAPRGSDVMRSNSYYGGYDYDEDDGDDDVDFGED